VATINAAGRAVLAGVMLCLSACASLPGDRLVGGASGPVEISRLDAAPPVIVFESGLLSYKETWNKIFSTEAQAHTVFAYDRPGVGRSDATTRPRDGRTIVEDLRALLHEQHLPPPYVLVGHSAGGLYFQLFARLYPQEVAGIVLVDPTHPTQFAGAGAMSNRSDVSRVAMDLLLTGTSKAEFDALNETGQEVLSAPPLRTDIPMVILVAPDRSGTTVADYDNSERRDFGKLYPTAILREVDSDHNIPQHRPQAIIDAIAEVLSASARRGVSRAAHSVSPARGPD
jgi:pimeloyl-ACP methyl ester carboxylesterase